LCTGDMGASAVKTYDIEVWIPSQNTYREISSCSNTNDYQARGLGIKYSSRNSNKTEFIHTLNGTGVSLNRLWVAIIENFQQKDGKILIPEILRKYMNDKIYIE
jgi:seryl-tRNA synthetase